MHELPNLQELTIGSCRYRISTDRAMATRYGGVKARLIPKDAEADAIEVYIGRNGRMYLPKESVGSDITNADIIKEYDSYLKFPTVGKSSTLYIDTTTNTAYRFSETDLKYYPINGIDVGTDLLDEIAKALKETEAVINGNANKVSITT